MSLSLSLMGCVLFFFGALGGVCLSLFLFRKDSELRGIARSDPPPLSSRLVHSESIDPQPANTGKSAPTASKIGKDAASADEPFFAMVENLSDGLRIVENGITTYVNKRFCEITGYSSDELLGFPDNMVFDEEQREIVKSQQKLRREGKKSSYEVALRRKDGTSVPTIVSAHPIFDKDGSWIGSCGVFTDITARIDAEIELRESEQRFKDYAESASDRFWEMNDQFRFTFISSREPERLVYDHSTILGKTRWEKAKGDVERDEHWRRHRDDLYAHRAFRNFRYTDVDDFGKEHHWTVSGKPVFDRNGVFRGYRGTSKELTAEVEAQRRASLAQTQLLNAFDTISEGFAIFDPDDKLILCNRRCAEIFPEVADVLIPGMTFEDIYRTAASRGIFEPKGISVEARVQERMLRRFNPTMRSVQQLQGNRWVQITERRTVDGGIVQVWTDITELKRGEQQLLQAQKMEAVGQLTGGIAHDFNNLLAVILGSLEMIQDRGDIALPFQKMVSRAVSASRRGAALTQRLLAFSRKQTLQQRPTDIQQLIENMGELFRTSLGESIQIITHFATPLPAALVDPNQFETVLLNLALNSRDAMPQGGRLIISADATVIDAETADDYSRSQAAMPCAPGRYVRITVADNGTGMTPEIKERIFEPFFTTKDVGKGSGLGLSMVYGYVTQSGGHISVESSPGLGTKIELLLAEAVGAQAAQEASDAEHRSPLSHGERILIVEDDDNVRELIVAILENLNYTVYQEPDGIAALRRLATGPEVDLLLSDVVLPGGMNGVQLAEEALRLNSSLKVLMMSGYMEDGVTERLGDAIPLLRKPFRTVELTERVRELLEQPQLSRSPLAESVQVLAGGPPIEHTDAAPELVAVPVLIASKS